MSLISDPRIQIVKQKIADLGVKIKVAARPSKKDPSGRKLYFYCTGDGKPKSVELEVRRIIQEQFPKSGSTSGSWGNGFDITIAEY